MKLLILLISIFNVFCLKTFDYSIPLPIFKNSNEYILSKGVPDQNYPIWPESFNTTLLKLNYHNSTIRWTKLFYDFKNKRTKFDFFTEYYGKEMKWGESDFQVLFLGNTCWFIYPKTKGFYFHFLFFQSVEFDQDNFQQFQDIG